MARTWNRRVGLVLVALGAVACGGGTDSAGAEAASTSAGGGSDGAGTADGGGGATAQGGGGATGQGGSTTSTGGGDSGGGGGATACAPGSTMACYTGPAGTENVGACKSGTQGCLQDGSGYGPCLGDVVPQAAESCGNGLDDDCNGLPDDTCSCQPGSTASCYTGPAGTDGVGICKAGTHTCAADGKSWSPCFGEALPKAEDCATPDDENCDGMVNEQASGCLCAPGDVASCYSGPPGTEGVGICAAGKKTCDASGTAWGACTGETLPAAESCATAADEECDGTPNEAADGCVCLPGTTQACYTGPQNTQGVGICHGGTQACAADGKSWSACNGQQLPAAEVCDNQLDDDCNGVACAATQWVLLEGDPSAQVVSSVATDAAGNVYIVGTFAGTLDLGGALLIAAGGTDVFVAKLDAAGNHLWSAQYGGADDQSARDIAVVGSSVYVTGRYKTAIQFGNTLLSGSPTQARAWVTKLDAGAGAVAWAKEFSKSQTSTDVMALAANASGVAVAGSFADPILGQQAFLRTFSSAGAVGLDEVYGDSAAQSINDVAYDPVGNLLVTGQFAGKINFGGAVDLDANVATDVFVAKIDGLGNQAWAKAFGDDPGNQYGRSVAVDAQGAVYLFGNFAGTTSCGGPSVVSTGNDDLFVCKLNSSGFHTWTKAFGTAGSEAADAISVDPAGNVVLGGRYSQPLSFGGAALPAANASDPYIAKLDPMGLHLWSKGFASNAFALETVGNVLATSAAVFFAGQQAGTVDYGTGPLFASGLDALLVKMSP